jgi:hypothetical protein
MFVRSSQPYIQWKQGAICISVKRSGREVDHSPSAEVKNDWNNTSAT